MRPGEQTRREAALARDVAALDPYAFDDQAGRYCFFCQQTEGDQHLRDCLWTWAVAVAEHEVVVGSRPAGLRPRRPLTDDEDLREAPATPERLLAWGDALPRGDSSQMVDWDEAPNASGGAAGAIPPALSIESLRPYVEDLEQAVRLYEAEWGSEGATLGPQVAAGAREAMTILRSLLAREV